LDLANFTSSDSDGFIIQGTGSYDYFGTSVSGAGDVNNDTYADVVVGAYNTHFNDKFASGAAYVVLGKGRCICVYVYLCIKPI
jgi:hypothetical protein